MVNDTLGRKVFYIHTDEHTAPGGNSSRNANRACSPRGTIDFMADEFIILWTVQEGGAIILLAERHGRLSSRQHSISVLMRLAAKGSGTHRSRTNE